LTAIEHAYHRSATSPARETVDTESATVPWLRRHRLLLVWGGRILIFVALFGSWQLLAVHGVLNPAFTGTPSKIAGELWDGVVHGTMLSDIAATLYATLIGFVAASIVGLAVALLLNESDILNAIFQPFLTALNSAPRIALAPLFILWFGLGSFGAIAVAFSLTFFIMLTNAMAGLASVDRDHLTLARIFRLGRLRTFGTFVWPGALPSIFAGLQLGLVYAFLGAVGEELLGGNQGLGAKMMLAASTFRMDTFFAELIALVIIAVAISQMLSAVERWLLRWRQAELRGLSKT
jgi:NitT/TauT family transport system permease protein